ncbi:DUF4157 domain-containing protein [Actinoplanes sp. CA-030573]|uniref:eCIS core domain-containing protein n=1 Tax=Actinoplanes sp. CA-030573 TaxID=3239898 RepID=UPI003D920184
MYARGHDEQRSDDTAAAPRSPAPGLPPSLLAAGNRAIVRLMAADTAGGDKTADARVATPASGVADAFSIATSDPAAPLPHRAAMEQAFDTSFAGVRAFTGGQGARAGLGALGAVAASYGDQVAFAERNPAPGTVAHELAHVMQTRAAGGSRGDPTAVSSPGDAAERSAHAAADAVLAGEPASGLGPAPDAVHRAVRTNGGTFDTASYRPISAPTGSAGEQLGAHIELDFTPGDLVESTKIGMIQTVKAMKASTPAGPRDTVATGVGDPEEGQLIMGPGQADPGRELDRSVHPGGRDQPNTSPIYGVHNSPAFTAAKLAEGTPGTGGSQWGSHTRDPRTGRFLPAVAARIDDTPGRQIEFDGQTFEQTFESTAIVVEGPMPVDTYLGSVSWGWRSDAAGDVTVDPVTLVRAGTPSAEFMGAAERWNAATFHDTASGDAATPVAVPLAFMDSGAVAAADRTTADLLGRLAVVGLELMAAQALGAAMATDQTNKDFERKALEAELRKRRVKVAVHVISTEDTIGSDEVYVTMTGPSGAVVRSATRDLDDGDKRNFFLPLASLLPLTGPLTIRVYDEDWPDADDLIVDMPFAAPWAPAHNTSSMDDAKYDVIVSFEK